MSRLTEKVFPEIRDFAFEFNFGEWFDKAVFVEFIRGRWNYSGTTPEQYASDFIKWAVANRDFETTGTQWRWIVHPQQADEQVS